MANKDEDRGEHLARTLKMFPFIVCLAVRLNFRVKASLGVISPCLYIFYLVVNLNRVFRVFCPGQVGHCRFYNHILPHHSMVVPSNLNYPRVQGFIQRWKQDHPGC
jgi:hypothetical protein